MLTTKEISNCIQFFKEDYAKTYVKMEKIKKHNLELLEEQCNYLLALDESVSLIIKYQQKVKILTEGLEKIEQECIGKYYDDDNNNFLFETSEFARKVLKESKEILINE